MEFIELKVEARETVGNGPARRLRQVGKIPGVLYGPDTEPKMIAMEAHALELAIHSGSVNSLFSLTLAGDTKAKRRVMIKELQSHPVSQTLVHVDFYEIAMDRKINVKVPVVTVGKSVGVELGGMLQVVRREVEVFCLPDRIPESIEIDISDMDIGASVHVEDISLEEGVEIPFDTNFTIITVLTPKVEEEEVEEEEEALEGEEEAADSETTDEGDAS